MFSKTDVASAVQSTAWQHHVLTEILLWFFVLASCLCIWTFAAIDPVY